LAKFIVHSALKLQDSTKPTGKFYDLQLNNGSKVFVEHASLREQNGHKNKQILFSLDRIFDERVIDEKIKGVIFTIYKSDSLGSLEVLNLDNWSFCFVGITKLWDFFDKNTTTVSKDELFAIDIKLSSYKTLRNTFKKEFSY
jgi:hypothetical protein